jgi:hypothetical protein
MAQVPARDFELEAGPNGIGALELVQVPFRSEQVAVSRWSAANQYAAGRTRSARLKLSP